MRPEVEDGCRGWLPRVGLLVLLCGACRAVPTDWSDIRARERLHDALRRNDAVGVVVTLELPDDEVDADLDLHLDRQQIEGELTALLADLDVFARVEPIEITGPGMPELDRHPEALERYLLQSLRDRSLDLLVHVSIDRPAKAGIGEEPRLGEWRANTTTVASVLLWPLLGFPSLVLRDREYETRMGWRIDVYDVGENRRLQVLSGETDNIEVAFLDRAGLAGWMLIPIVPGPWTPHDTEWMGPLLEGVIRMRLAERVAEILKVGDWDPRGRTIGIDLLDTRGGVPIVSVDSMEVIRNLRYQYDVTEFASFPEEQEVRVPPRKGFRYQTLARLPQPEAVATWLRVVVETMDGSRLSRTFRLDGERGVSSGVTAAGGRASG